jgi:hypothetical protein
MPEIFIAHIVAKSMLEIYGKNAVREVTQRALAAKAAGDAEAENEWNQVAFMVTELDARLPMIES